MPECSATLGTAADAPGIEADIAALKGIDRTRVRLTYGYCGTQQVRLIAAQLRSTLPVEREISLSRIRSVELYLQGAEEIWEGLAQRVNRHASGIQYSFLAGLVQDDEDIAERAKLSRCIDQISVKLRQQRDEMTKACCTATLAVGRSRDEELSDIKLHLTLDETGKVVTAERFR